MSSSEPIQLYLLRHADAGDRQAWTGNDDERPLTAKGRRQSEQLGRFLASIDFQPGIILTSPKARAFETAELVAAAIGQSVETDDRLGSSFRLSGLEKLLANHDAASPLLVGHDPDFSTVVATLCGASRVPLKKGALVRIDVKRPLQPGGGTLRWLLPPDLVKSGE